MDEQLTEILFRDLFIYPDGTYEPRDINKVVHELKALLATEYDRGRQDMWQEAVEPRLGTQAEYDRGKVEGAIEELENLRKNYFGHIAAARRIVDFRLKELKGESNGS